MRRQIFSQGFTAVELLATLFIAAMFLVSGYQLYNLVIRDGGETRTEANAANLAYDYLRRYSSSAAENTCVAKTALASQPVIIEGAANATVQVVVSCPQTSAPRVNKVEVIVQYGIGADARTVRQSTYVDGSTVGTNNGDIINGLIGWWPLNGNSDSLIGGLHGTSANTSSGTGQNNQSANALLFNGSSSTVAIPLSAIEPRPTGPFTISAWVKFNTVSLSAAQSIVSTTEGGGWSYALQGSGNSACVNRILFNVYINGAYRSACGTSFTPTAGSWIHAVGVYEGGYTRLYINKTLTASTAVSGNFTWPSATTTPLCLGGEPSTTNCNQSAVYLNGALDDVRYYGRALSASEVTDLYNNGAK